MNEPLNSNPPIQNVVRPDRLQIDFTEQAVTDGALAAQSTLDTTGPSRLTPMSEEDKRMQLTPQQEQSLETVQAVTALREHVWSSRINK